MGKLHDSSNAGPSDAAVPALSSNNPFKRFFKSEHHHLGTDATYEPPPGPPPSKKAEESFQPPERPPPSHQSFAPPPGPPPSHGDEPPPYDPWLTVPDNSSLPPPPSISYLYSPTANASESDAEAGRAFTQSHPLAPPLSFSPSQLSEIKAGHLTLSLPPSQSKIKVTTTQKGTTRIRSPPNTRDTTLITTLPILPARSANPSLTSVPVTIYFELKINALDLSSAAGSEISSGASLGLLAPPYPLFRLPGWERASLGVHSDDGRRYVNDNCGGKDFVSAFQEGETLGLGMKFAPAQGRNSVECFFTRDGKLQGSWNLWEERDGEDGDADGLGGDRDLCAAVGLFGSVDVEVRLRRDEWLFRP